MQMIDIATVKAAKATDRRSLAILAYDNASAEPEGANWHAVADMLRFALPAVKAAKIPEAETDPRFAPWADYPIPQNASARKLGKSPVVVVTLADGETVRAPAVSLPGKPVNVGRAIRVAIAFYQARMAIRAGENSDWSACIAVPAIVAVTCETNGTEYNATDCSARSAEWRSGSYDAAAVAAASLSYPEKADDGSLTRADFVRASYRLAMLRRQLAEMPEGDDLRPITYPIEWCELRLAGWTELQIRAKWNAEDAARIAAERKAAEEAERAASEPAPAPEAPRGFRVPSKLLATSRLSLVSSNPPAAPSPRSACILRVVA